MNMYIHVNYVINDEHFFLSFNEDENQISERHLYLV